jgi:hypothetical protein
MTTGGMHDNGLPRIPSLLGAIPISVHPWPIPAVAFAEQHNEVGLDAGLLAERDFAQADLHRLPVERRIVADAPA